MISVTLSPNHYKSREREGSKEDERETEPAELPKRPNNAPQTVEQRQACLQRRRDRLAAESTEQREARLQQVRTDRLAAEGRLQQLRTI